MSISCFYIILSCPSLKTRPKKHKISKIFILKVFYARKHLLRYILKQYNVHNLFLSMVNKFRKFGTVETENSQGVGLYLYKWSGFPGFSGNSSKFKITYLRAQEELEARKTCVVTPGTWFKRRNNPIEKIFSRSFFYSSITSTAKPAIRLHTPIRSVSRVSR